VVSAAIRQRLQGRMSQPLALQAADAATPSFLSFFLMACAIFCLLERGGAGASKKKQTRHSHARPDRRTNVLDRVSNQIRACIAS
jgi:hypothetical protein